MEGKNLLLALPECFHWFYKIVYEGWKQLLCWNQKLVQEILQQRESNPLNNIGETTN